MYMNSALLLVPMVPILRVNNTGSVFPAPQTVKYVFLVLSVKLAVRVII